MKTLRIRKGQNIVLHMISSNFHKNISDGILNITCYDETLNKRVYNTVNDRIIFTENNGIIIISNLITENHTYRLTFSNKRNKHIKNKDYVIKVIGI